MLKKIKSIGIPLLSLSILSIIPILGLAQTIDNPLGANNTSVQAVLLKIMKLVAEIGGVVVVFFIILSGYNFVTAGGDEGKVTKAREMFFATIIGGAILLGAGVIASVVVGTVNNITH